MEEKDLLHPETDENQNVEVNAGASEEAQTNAVQTPPAAEEAAAEQPVAEPQPVVANEPENSPTAETTQSVAEKTPEVQDSVAEMMADIENTQAEAIPVTESENDDEVSEESVEQIEREYFDFTLEQAVDELQKVVVEPNYNKIKNRVGVLKSKAIKKIKELKKELFDKFIEEGGNKDEYQPEELEIEKKFHEALNIFKNNKDKFLAQLEEEKQKNLQTKLSIIENLKELLEADVTLKERSDKFREYEEQWKAVGKVPQSESNNLWQNYHFYVDKFYDLLRINKELRSLDLKKNLEQKIKLCEQAESLLLEDSINKSFKMLQQLHEEWKELGPVAEEKKEEIWERFKNASDRINQRRREFYDKLYAEQENNYNAKVVLCEKAEELIAQDATSIKENNAISDQLTELLKVWKTLGPAPAKVNDEIWERFKTSLDKFFQAKKEYFQQLKDTQTQNYNMKVNLAIKAEAISERTDWRAATEELIGLQKEWKEIGSVPRKNAEAIWKRFRAACDKFFEAKANYFANKDSIEKENQQKKEDLIQRILGYEFTGNKNDDLEMMKAFQREWTEIGFVPKNEKDRLYNEYKTAVNQRFADMKVSMEEVRHSNFKNRIDNILNDPNADRLLDKEKRFLVNKLTQLKEDINLWENNLGFFSNSKNADLLKEEFSKKIEAAKVEVKELEYKIKMMNNPEKKNGEK